MAGMRRIPKDPLLLFPAFILELSRPYLTLLWERLRGNAEGLPPPGPYDDAFSFMEMLMQRVVPNEELVNLLFSLGLAAARMRWGSLPKDFGGNTSEWVVNSFCRYGEEALDEMSLLSLPPGRGDCIFVYDGPMAGTLEYMVDEKLPPDIPHVRKSFYPSYIEDKEPTNWTWMGLTISWDGARGKVERFYPENCSYIVYQPGLNPQEANRSLLTFCEAAYMGELVEEEKAARSSLTGEALSEELEDLKRRHLMLEEELEEAGKRELYPLMMPLEVESFGKDEVLTGFCQSDLVDMIWLHKGLAMPRHEWRKIRHCFPSKAFIDTGNTAEEVMDARRPGEKCKVSPLAKKYNNIRRSASVASFEEEGDAEIVSLKATLFVREVFNMLVGKAADVHQYQRMAVYWVNCGGIRIYLSLATSEENLVQQIQRLSSKASWEFVIITAFLDSSSGPGVLSLRGLCRKSHDWGRFAHLESLQGRAESGIAKLRDNAEFATRTMMELERMDDAALREKIPWSVGCDEFSLKDLMRFDHKTLVELAYNRRWDVSYRARFVLAELETKYRRWAKNLKEDLGKIRLIEEMRREEWNDMHAETLHTLVHAGLRSRIVDNVENLAREELVELIIKNRREIDRNSRNLLGELKVLLIGSSALRPHEIWAWRRITEAAVTPVVMMREMGVPKAPEWADWENLEIRYKNDRTGHPLIQFAYLGTSKGFLDIQSKWLPISALPMFCRGERPNKECGKLLGILDPHTEGESRRRGRPPKREQRKKTHGSPKNDAERQCIYSLGLKLAELTGLPKRVGGILNSDGTPVFCVKNYPDDRENGIAYNDSMAAKVDTTQYKRDTRSKGPSISQQATSREILDDMLAQRRAQAEGGDPEAQFNLGLTYERGAGEEKDLPQAAAWYERAAKQGHAEAMYRLGLMYENGCGVKADMTTAEKWMMLAAERKHEEAINWCQGRGEA